MIDLPEPNRPATDATLRPRAYWDGYNKGLLLYRRRKYGQAKVEFLKLLDYSPHRTALTYLVRTYRKLIAQHIANDDFTAAYSAFGEFFQNCPDLTTATDARRFRKVLAAIRKHDAGFVSAFQIPDFGPAVPELQVDAAAGVNVQLSRQDTIYRAGTSKIGRWSFVQEIGNRTLYVKSFYNAELSKYDRSLIRVRGPDGAIERELDLAHGTYRLGSSSHDDCFVVSSDEMKAYIYSASGHCLGQYDLQNFSHDKYHLRTVGITPQKRFLLFTYVDQAMLFDSRVDMVDWWVMPPKEGWKRVAGGRLPPEYHRSLSVLGLSQGASTEEIKKAWRRQIFEYHPDRNPGNPLATDRARELNIAYAYLTGEDAVAALREMGMTTYEREPSESIRMTIPGTDLVIEFGVSLGSGEDWIYALGVGEGDDRLYIGCYSGKVYCLNNNRQVSTIYNCHDVPRSIRQRESALFIEIDAGIYVLENSMFLNYVEKPQTCSLRWGQRGFLIADTKTLRAYSLRGELLCRLAFKHSISDCYFTSGGFSVETANRFYAFVMS